MRDGQRHLKFKRRSFTLLLITFVGVSTYSLSARAQLELRPQTTGKSIISDEKQPAGKQSITSIVTNNLDVTFAVAHSPSKKFKAIRIKIQNKSDSPLVVDANRCVVASSSNGQPIAHCISQKQLDTVGRPPTTFGEKLSADVKDTVTSAASVGVVQTAKTFAIQAGPIEKRYEYDHERQVNEESRFGQRLVYPGESTEGNIYFDARLSLENGLIQIPVKMLYDAGEEATLNRPIRLTTEGKDNNRVQE